MNLAKYVWFVLFVSVFVLSACGGATPSPDEFNAIMTEGVGTMVAAFFDTQTAMYTPPLDTATATQTPFNTVTPFASTAAPASPTIVYYTATLGTRTPGTPTPTGTLSTATVNPGALEYGCNNLAFIRDVTIPSGTVLLKNQTFTKTWKVQNTGTCNWMFQYQLVLFSGDPYGGKNYKIQKVVTPNDWSELSVNLTAPKNPGTYTSYWRLQDAEGHMFGATLVVSFKVEAEPTAVPTFTPTLVPTVATTNSPDPTYTPTATPTYTPIP
jgi:Ig-like domain from next to BRCA1 gene